MDLEESVSASHTNKHTHRLSEIQCEKQPDNSTRGRLSLICHNGHSYQRLLNSMMMKIRVALTHFCTIQFNNFASGFYPPFLSFEHRLRTHCSGCCVGAGTIAWDASPEIFNSLENASVASQSHQFLLMCALFHAQIYHPNFYDILAKDPISGYASASHRNRTVMHLLECFHYS